MKISVVPHLATLEVPVNSTESNKKVKMSVELFVCCLHFWLKFELLRVVQSWAFDIQLVESNKLW